MKLPEMRRSRLFLGIVGAGFLFVAMGRVLLPGLVLEVRDTRAGDLLLNLAVKKGDRFLLRYTHSTAKTVVEEHFQIAGSHDIVLTRMVYSSCGAGIPDIPPARAYFKIGSDGRFVMDGLDRHFSSLNNIRVAYFYPFVLELEGKRHPLSDNARGRLVDILVQHWVSSALERFIGDNEK